MTIILAGEVWDISHQRKGTFTALFERNTNLDQNTFCELVIMEGRAKFASMENWISGAGDTGRSIESRCSFITLLKRRPELEEKK